mmetsp:Transcript_30406/g.73343  ORF Transcript_30406/g.73343 Transcript_30406/m.73343 type:complete len:133 (+) Transcript_30406:812-1210(+)
MWCPSSIQTTMETSIQGVTIVLSSHLRTVSEFYLLHQSPLLQLTALEDIEAERRQRQGLSLLFNDNFCHPEWNRKYSIVKSTCCGGMSNIFMNNNQTYLQYYYRDRIVLCILIVHEEVFEPFYFPEGTPWMT